MTSQDFIRTEAANTDRIILYREGLFWKAYERSAFAVCSQVRAFKTTKKALKTLGGGHLVSIGFPAASENAVCGALECISREQDRVVFAAPRAVDAAEFEVWKAAQPLKEAVRRTKTAVAAVDADVAAADTGGDDLDQSLAGFRHGLFDVDTRNLPGLCQLNSFHDEITTFP